MTKKKFSIIINGVFYFVLSMSLDMLSCFSQYSINVKKHQDQNNFYNEKHLIKACLQFWKFSLLSSWWEVWQHIVRHGAEEGAESSALDPQAVGREPFSLA